ncbi:hypothetical protein SCP94_16180, partial [Legionella pneumophila serogroup 1]
MTRVVATVYQKSSGNMMQFCTVTDFQMTIHHHREGGLEMDKQNETRRVMMTLSDQAIAKLDQLVA